jgi:hypothetical protein
MSNSHTVDQCLRIRLSANIRLRIASAKADDIAGDIRATACFSRTLCGGHTGRRLIRRGYTGGVFERAGEYRG